MSRIQFGGLASGLDTAALVDAMLATQRVRVDRVFQRRVQTQWQQEALVNASNTYANFILKMRNSFGIADSVSTHGMTRPGTVNNLNWVNRATSSNESVVTARATASASKGRHQLEVHQVADVFRVGSTNRIELGEGGRLGFEGETTFTLSNGSDDPTVIQLTEATTMDDLVRQMNAVDGVTASFDQNTGRFFIQTTETGADHQVIFGGDGAEAILSQLNLELGVANDQGEFSGRGQNAIVDFNGAKGLEFSSNQFNLQGIEFSLRNASVGEIVTVTVETDVDSVFDKVKEFINEYNAMMLEMNRLLTEPVNRDFPPLTDEQRAGMSEKEIEAWETQAKSGILRSEPSMTAVQQQLRMSMMQEVQLADGTRLSLHDFGIQGVSKPTPQTSGMLQVDEEKLRAAIANNPEGVLEVFFAVPNDRDLHTSDRNLTPAQIQTKREQSGIFNRITDVITSGIGQMVQRAGAGEHEANFRQINTFIMSDFVAGGSRALLDTRINEFNRQISALNQRLSLVEARYWRQFTAMETAIANMQNQQNSLFGMWG